MIHVPTKVQELVNLLRFTEKIDYAIPCKEDEKHIVGEKYYNSYWGYSYDVISIDRYNITIKRDNGEIVTHHTPLSASDWHFIKAQPWQP